MTRREKRWTLIRGLVSLLALILSGVALGLTIDQRVIEAGSRP